MMRNILIFGGNGFIGSETVLRLLDSSAFKLSLVNRDRSWDKGLRAKVFPRLEAYFKWDRKKPLEQCPKLVEWVRNLHTIDYVLDFSGYKPGYLEDATHFLRGKVACYIYISTDSVYEICEKTHDGPTRESDDKRPEDKRERKSLAKSDKYGCDKWKSEDVLRKSGMPYTILRLADVMGPRDSTDRWPQLQLWVKAADKCRLPVYISLDLKYKLISLVYVKDVARLILSLVNNDIVCSETEDNAFNIAFSETVTVHDLVSMIASKLGCGFHRVQFIDSSSNIEVVQIFPSVEKGPVDISKSTRILKWKPTPIHEAVMSTVEFYENMFVGNMDEEESLELFGSVMEDFADCYNKKDVERLREALRDILKLPRT